MLRVSLIGNLGAEPETRTSQKGTPMTTFRVAVDQVRADAEDDRQESTAWFRVRAMGWLGEFTRRLGKGSRVLVVGRLEISHYQSREGEPRVGFDVWADDVQNAGGRGAGDETDGRAPAGAASGDVVDDGADLEDLPF